MNMSEVSFVATDVGLWMALPAVAPALIIVGVFTFIIRRDRRRHPESIDTDLLDPGGEQR